MANENKKRDIKILSAEAIYQMGKLSAKHKAKGHIETPEERQERSDVLNYCLAYISQFPQAQVLDQRIEEVAMWLEKSYRENPEKTFWHVVRAGGIGGSDMGVLYAATEGDQGQSPFQTNRDIIKSKLFRVPIGEDSIHTSRGTRMEGYVKDLFLKDLAIGNIVENTLSAEEKSEQRNNAEKNPLYGAKSILDEKMEMAFTTFYDPEHPWLNGNPDEIIMKPDGKIVIVDYKAPVNVESTIPDYYLAQVHHYGIIFKKQFPELADKVESVALASFNYREGAEVIYKEVPFDSEIERKVLEIGDKYWNDYVMKDVLPKSIEFGVTTELEDLQVKAVERDEDGKVIEVVDSIDLNSDVNSGIISPDAAKVIVGEDLKLSSDGITDALENLLARYSTTRHMSREGELVSEDYSFAIKRLILNKLNLEEDADSIKTPTANISLIKRYDLDAMLPDLQDYWKKLNISEKTLQQEIYNNPRAYLSNEFDPNALFSATQKYMNEMAFYFNYKSGSIDKTPDQDEYFEMLENKFTSDLKLRKGSNNLSLMNIPEFMEAINTERRELDVDYLIKYTQRMDPTNGFPFRNYIDYNASDITIRLRQPRSTQDLKIVDEFKAGLREELINKADTVGLSYAAARRDATHVDVEAKKAQDILDAERKEAEKQAERERKLAEKQAAEEAKKREKELADSKKLGDVSVLDQEDKKSLSDDVDNLLSGSVAPKKRRVIKK